MIADVTLDHLRHEAVHRATRGCDQTEHIAAFRVAIQRARERLDLTADTRHAVGELLLLANGVRHDG